MTHFSMPVTAFMSAPVRTVSPDAPIADAYNLLREYKFSGLAVTEGSRLVGVLSRTDLLHLGRVTAAGKGRRGPALDLPNKPVRDVMKKDVVRIAPQGSVSEAAGLMVSNRIHRVFVEDGGSLKGVISTKDVMVAIGESRARRPISDFMSTPILTLRTTDTLQAAVERLDEAHISGFVVLDEDEAPAGVFTQAEALQAKGFPPSTIVEDVMNYAIICMHVTTPIHRAAAQGAATSARRIVAVEGRKIWGILTGIDFARAAI